jgi:hypothetical protein
MSLLKGHPMRRPWDQRLWLIVSLLFMLAAWQQPTKRAVHLSLGVVFGIFGLAAARRP